jgi:tetratricopeptide (TPR) repeat protein
MNLARNLGVSALPVLLAALLWAAGPPGRQDELARHRNLGKAFYENPTTQAEAVAEFRKALDLAPGSNREKLNYGLALLRAGNLAEGVAALLEVQRKDPSLPHTWFNLGIYYKKSGDEPKATAQFERLAALAPDEPTVHYQLATLYKLAGRTADALAQFELTVRLDPRLAAARFQLYNMYRQANRPEDAARSLEVFQRLKKEAEGAVIPEDVDWCTFAEIYDPPVAPAPPPAIPAAAYQDRILEGALDAPTAGLAAIDSTGSGQIDLLAWSARGIVLYRNGAARVEDSGLAGIAGVVSVALGDFDNDGLMDLCILTEKGPLLYRNVKGRFAPQPANLPQRRFDRAVWMDYDHDYDLDLLLFGETPALMRNEGSAGFADRTADFPFVPGLPTGALKLRVMPDSKAFDLAVFYRGHEPVLYRDSLGGRYSATPWQGSKPAEDTVTADFDNDGRPDIARVAADGRLHLATYRGKSADRWIRIQLEGVKSLKLAQDAEVEVKAGALYRKQAYAGVPLVFDTGTARTVDAVRITWPNGLIQNEVNQPAGQPHLYKEAQRLSGSCPMIWTWNGRHIQFITDVLGVAPLGASDGEGTYFPVDHDEYVSLPAAALQPVRGEYDIRVTEELSEVSYLDQVLLLAVDHPASTSIFTNEKFKGPPYPEFRLFGVERRIYPRAARDDAGHDVLERLLARDQRYPDDFQIGRAHV